MQKIIFFPILLTALIFTSCKKEDMPTDGVLLDNGTFEKNGNFNTDGWELHNCSSDTDVPAGGGNFSLKVSPGSFPDEGYADYVIENLSGSKTFVLKAWLKAFDSWPGNVSLRKVSSGGSVSVLGLEATSENVWVEKTITATTAFNNGDVLVVRLSAGSSEVPLTSQYVLCDLISLEEQ
ncbi:MAG: hypothetical protein R2794_09405 [Chitinophagales bacterium]